MNHDYLTVLKTLRTQLENHRVEARRTEESLKIALNNLLAKCDHKNPDGSLALGIIACKICGALNVAPLLDSPPIL